MRRSILLFTAMFTFVTTASYAQTIERRPLPAPAQPGQPIQDPARDFQSPVDPNPNDGLEFPQDGGTAPLQDETNFSDPDDPFASQQTEDDTLVAPDPSQMDAEVSEPAPAVADKPVKNKVATFTGIDKITGRIHSFDVYVDETVQFGALLVTPRVCISRPGSLEPKTDSFVEIDEMTLDRKVRRIFTGWMFAESPGLNAVEHAVYDVWLKACKQDTDVPPPDTQADAPESESNEGVEAEGLTETAQQ